MNPPQAAVEEKSTPQIDETIPGGWPNTPGVAATTTGLGNMNAASRSSCSMGPETRIVRNEDIDAGIPRAVGGFDGISAGPDRREVEAYVQRGPAALVAPRGGSPKPASSAQLSGFTVADSQPSSPDEPSIYSNNEVAPTVAPSQNQERFYTQPIKTAQSYSSPHSGEASNPTCPPPPRRKSTVTEEDLYRVLSRRRTTRSEKGASAGGGTDEDDIDSELEALLARIFGSERQSSSKEEKTRHVGVVFRNLTVKVLGLDASLMPTNGDIFLGPIRKIKRLLGGGGLGRKTQLKTLLNDFSGCVRPGEMLLVLGRPGSGCSTFLKAIGNQKNGFEEANGRVTYGGVDVGEMAKKFRGEIVYNPEEDLHYATLSVKQTLKFALKTRTPGKDSRKEGETRKDYVTEFLRVVSKLFWIEHTMDTKVGNEYVRGVSGGEKKRVSIAEAMITKASCQCWDNSTRGLDASTAVEYVKSLRILTNMAQISTFVALYQAGESLYDLFDKVLLVDGGRCAYFGPAESAKAYFEGLGFVCPPRWTTADFLTSVTDEHERQVREGWENRIPRSPEELEKAYANSDVARLNMNDIADFEATLGSRMKERDRNEGGKKEKDQRKNYTLSFYGQVMACTKRQFLVMKGDPMSLGGKWGGILFQAIIVGSLFFNLPKTSAGVFPRGGVLFFALLFNALLALAELTSAFDSRPILLKHRSFSFYRPAAYAIAQTFVDIPLTFIQVTIFSVIVYFMANLQRTAAQFFTSLFIIFVLTMSMYSFFRMIGSLSGNLNGATRITGVAIQALIVYTGYLIPPTSMRPWLSWLRWINPVQYGFEALMANEFNNLEIQCEPPFLVPAGPNIDPAYQSCLIQGSRPGSQSVLGQDYIMTAYGYSHSHLWRNVGFIVAFWLFFVALTAVGMELQKPNKGGGAVTVFKRGQTPVHVEKLIGGEGSGGSDEEKGRSDDDQVTGLGASDSDGNEQPLESIARNEAVFTFQDVNYTIPSKRGHRKLLRNVQGYVRPGKLTALMGGSGAGKTTLLNTLAQRINFGVVEGTFLVDGRPLPKSFQRATGFAEQMDVHEPTATVREALRFSALLRQPKEVPVEEKYEYVERILTLLEMQDIAGAIVGIPGKGLNQEQRKRLTIGVELASKPELLMFLDEPTSGLDSSAAFNIVRLLRKLADAGQAILCTIHQPSAVLFEHFDELILLQKSGRIVYHGELGRDSQVMIKYFEENGGHKCPKDKNPAEYMLDVIGSNDKKSQDWADVWENSTAHNERTEEIQKLIFERRSRPTASNTDDREFAMPWSTQVTAVVKRTFTSYWRSPDYIVGKFMLHIFTGLFNTFTFWNLGNSTIDMQSRLFSIFMTLTISPPLIQQLQPRFIQLRDIFKTRESSSKIYSSTAFSLAVILVEVPYSLLAGTLYFMCWYWGIGFPRDSFSIAFTWSLIMLFELYYVSLGQAIAAFSPNELLASLLVPIFFTFVVSFCGVVVPYAMLPKFWRSWLYHLTPFRYLLEALLGVLTHNVPVKCSTSEFATFPPPPGISCEEYLAPYISQVRAGYVETSAEGVCRFCQFSSGDEFSRSFNVFWEQRWRDWGVFWAYVLFDFVVVVAGTWLYLGGWRRMRALVMGGRGRGKK